MLLFSACSTEDNSAVTDNESSGGDSSAQIKGTVVTTNTDKTLKAVCFANETVGYIAGGKITSTTTSDSAIVLKTTDGGTTWSSVFTDTGYYIISLFATSPTVVYATTSNNFILKVSFLSIFIYLVIIFSSPSIYCG